MKAEKIREMSADDLKAKEKELAGAALPLRFQKAIGQLDNAPQGRARPGATSRG